MINRITGYIKCRGGYSLVEVLVTLLIFAVLAAAVSTVLLVGESSWQVNSVRVELQQELRKAMDWMKDDLRQTAPQAIISGPTDADGVAYTSITFYLPNGISGNTIAWSANAAQFILGGPDSNQLQRIEGGTTKVIAQNIQAVGFTRYAAASDIIEVTLQAQKNTIKGHTITSNLAFKIQMRN